MEALQLTDHFNLTEFLRSDTATQCGIENEPSVEAIINLQNLCAQVLEPLRKHYGHAITITSGYRCPELNSRVGGVAHSQHLTGEAADLHLPSTRVGQEWMEWIRTHCEFDQLIYEKLKSGVRWIHVSCKRLLSKNRKQVI